ncbi:MAG: hypothetical protein ACRDNZ_24260 [Streptosporangiaceae bacterium]
MRSVSSPDALLHRSRAAAGAIVDAMRRYLSSFRLGDHPEQAIAERR